MPISGSNTLGELRQRKLRISCDKCGLKLQFDVAELIRKCGPGEKLPDLKNRLTKCDKLDVSRLYDYCKAVFEVEEGKL